MNKIALDTNILVYSFDPLSFKSKIADDLIAEQPIVSAQVVSEFLNVSKRLLKIPKLEILKKCNLILVECIIVPTTQTVLNHAEKLIAKYDLQLFDAIVVASALEANCTTLYSEDMHHSLVIEGTLSIINPFL
jgi:predicted nucleic acid-binding protein